MRWVKLDETSAVLSGPGPLPTYINDSNGDPLRTSLATADDFARCGWIEVTEDRRSYDRRFEVETGPEFIMADGIPTDRYTYSYRTNARYLMEASIDMMSEQERRTVITALPGQMAEYDEVVREATLALEDEASGITPVEGQYPYLEADVGISMNPDTQAKVQTLFEAAEVVLKKHRDAVAFGAQLRAKRLAAKQAVREASTDANAHQVVQEFSPTITEMFVLEPNSTHPYDEAHDVWNPNLVPLVQ